jgi:hypothetical protein
MTTVTMKTINPAVSRKKNGLRLSRTKNPKKFLCDYQRIRNVRRDLERSIRQESQQLLVHTCEFGIVIIDTWFSTDKTTLDLMVKLKGGDKTGRSIVPHFTAQMDNRE